MDYDTLDSARPQTGVSRYHLLRFNNQQDFLFIRIDIDKRQDLSDAEFERAPGGVWVGEYSTSDDEENVHALVFVNAMTGKGVQREEVVDSLNRAVSRLARRLEAQIAEEFSD